jgi:hypothetical protein
MVVAIATTDEDYHADADGKHAADEANDDSCFVRVGLM